MDTNTLWYLLGGCFALGMFHGVIPDEHTWPITFAYSVGTTTGRGGMKSGAWFSFAFTLQRAIMSMIVFLVFYAVLGSWGTGLATGDVDINGPVYLAVGIAMAVAGWLLLTDRIPHFHPLMRVSQKDLARHTNPDGTPKTPTGEVPTHWCFIHGFVSGFGTDSGILSFWIYFITIPFLAANGLWQIGWLPGALFGIGTFVVLMFIGYFFGEVLQISKRVGPNRMAQFGRLVGARVLLYGGLAFIVFSPIYWSGFYNQYVPFDAGSFIVILILVVMAVPIMIYTWREVQKFPRDFPTTPVFDPDVSMVTAPPPNEPS